MDNITHSLIGAAFAELTYQTASASRNPPSPRIRWWGWGIAILASSFPDIDFSYSWITPGRLGYLLHHRGHTHTLIGTIPQGLFLMGIVWALSRYLLAQWTKREWKYLWILCLGSLLLHILMDSVNNYGVHPFWPFNNRWFYGDFIFIIEPWIWILLSGGMLFLPVGRWGKILLVGVACLGLFLSWNTGYVPKVICVLLLCTYVAICAVSLLKSPVVGFRTSLVATVVVMLSFLFTSRYAYRQMRAWFRHEYMTRNLHDVLLTPLPGNPFCWSFITVSSLDRDYFLQTGVFRPWKRGGLDRLCPVGRELGNTLVLTPPTKPPEDPRVSLRGEAQLDLRRFHALHAESCEGNAFMRFARAPFFVQEGNKVLLGDLRYDREAGHGFSEMLTDHNVPCPPNVPNWTHPRAEDLMKWEQPPPPPEVFGPKEEWDQ